jgi:hypothetical protein
MLQNDEKEVTPRIVERIKWWTSRDATAKTIPANANSIQLFTPK